MARQILSINPQLAVYGQSQHAADGGVSYKREKALCHRGTKDTPVSTGAISTCANIARTDRHAAGLRRWRHVLDQQAAQVPGPLGERLISERRTSARPGRRSLRTRITVQPLTQWAGTWAAC